MADHLIDEVDDALRRERVETFWKRFGQYVVAGSIGVLLFTIGAVLWQNHKQSQNEAWTHEMLQAHAAMEDKDYSKAETALKAAKQRAHGNLETLTALWGAQLALKQKKHSEAKSALSALVGDGAYHDFALLLQQSAAGKTGDTTEVFRLTALEIEAAQALAQGDKKTAIATLQSIAKDALAPQSMHARAQLLLASLNERPALANNASPTE